MVQILTPPWQSLFVHPTEHYDFLVRLDRVALPRYHHNVAADASALFGKSGKYANIRLAVANGEPVPMRPGFDPAQLFFDDLKVRARLSCEGTFDADGAYRECTPTRSKSSTTISVETSTAPSGIRR